MYHLPSLVPSQSHRIVSLSRLEATSWSTQPLAPPFKCCRHRAVVRIMIRHPEQGLWLWISGAGSRGIARLCTVQRQSRAREDEQRALVVGQACMQACMQACKWCPRAESAVSNLAIIPDVHASPRKTHRRRILIDQDHMPQRDSPARIQSRALAMRSTF